MPAQDRLKLVRDAYGAYESGDRSVIEGLLSEDFTFYSPPDPGIDRATCFERCWPNAATIESFEFVRLAEVGEEVLVTYESTKRTAAAFATRRSTASTATGSAGWRSTSAGTSPDAAAGSLWAMAGESPQKVEKPWGHEIWWAQMDAVVRIRDRYGRAHSR